MVGIYSSKITIDGIEQIKNITEDYSIIITDIEEINNIETGAIIIVVFNKYSQVEELMVYEKGYEYYSNIKHVQKLVTNIVKHRLKKEEILFSKASNIVTINGKEIQLSKKEYALFEFLNRERGKKCNRKQILKEVFNYHEDAETRIVDVYIKHLRTKLDGEGKKIETIRGEGYIYHK